jgi:hypothetical protein
LLNNDSSASFLFSNSENKKFLRGGENTYREIYWVIAMIYPRKSATKSWERAANIRKSFPHAKLNGVTIPVVMFYKLWKDPIAAEVTRELN